MVCVREVVDAECGEATARGAEKVGKKSSSYASTLYGY